MTIQVLDIPASDDPATAIFNVWFDNCGLDVSRETARIIFDAGINTGMSANFRAQPLRVYEQTKLAAPSRLLLTA